jgi:hypothetical protein
MTLQQNEALHFDKKKTPTVTAHVTDMIYVPPDRKGGLGKFRVGTRKKLQVHPLKLEIYTSVNRPKRKNRKP